MYDRGNDFYNYFLGEMMLYTSGVYESEVRALLYQKLFQHDLIGFALLHPKTQNDTLKQAQENKMNIACRKIHLKEGERLLDIGCGTKPVQASLCLW